MRIIHFIEIAHVTTINFIKEIAGLIPGDHVVVNQDPYAMRTWTVPDTSIVVHKALLLSEKFLATVEPDLILNYTPNRDFCNWHTVIDISTGLSEHGFSTCMVDVASTPKTTHFLDPKHCRIIDLSHPDYDVRDAHIAFYVADEGDHEPRRIIECMAAGIPVVANRTHITSQLVMNGINGLLVAADEVIDDAIQALAQDPDTRHELGAAAIHWVEQTADIQVCVDAIRKAHGDNTGNIG